MLEVPRARPKPPQPYCSPLEATTPTVDATAQSRAPCEHAPEPAATALERLHSRLALVESQLSQCSAELELGRNWSIQAIFLIASSCSEGAC